MALTRENDIPRTVLTANASLFNSHISSFCEVYSAQIVYTSSKFSSFHTRSEMFVPTAGVTHNEECKRPKFSNAVIGQYPQYCAPTFERQTKDYFASRKRRV